MITNKQNSNRQAVFLDNGQVFFGRVTNRNDQYVKLTDVYYLPPKNYLLDGNTTEKRKFTLIKLGEEVHGPTDEMLINRDQILFIESMRNDSRINQAIKEALERKNNPTPAPSDSASPTPESSPTS
jgi:hypothetical protein